MNPITLTDVQEISLFDNNIAPSVEPVVTLERVLLPLKTRNMSATEITVDLGGSGTGTPPSENRPGTGMLYPRQY